VAEGGAQMTSPDPKLDLVFERIVDLSPASIYEAWTTPEHLKKWFTPAPWTTVECEIDLRPGGIFRTVMHSPEGQEFSNVGTYLEIVPQRKLVWTDALLPGFRPKADLFMTAIISLEPHGQGTRYKATVLHKDQADRERHEDMDFFEGWEKSLNQLIALMKGL
jgi:uncharacterized protein YndB with AHSA1/START domain